MASKVEEATYEIQERLTAFAPQYEGLLDLGRLNMDGQAAEEVRVATAAFAQRIKLMNAALAANQALLADGHPNLELKESQPKAYDIIAENAMTVAAAFGLFHKPQQAETLKLDPGVVEPK